MPTFELVERASQMNSYLLFVSLLSLTFVAYARIGTPDAIALSWKRFWKMSRTESFGFDDDKIRPETQTFLLINFFIAFSLSVYLFLLSYFPKEQAAFLSLIWVAIYITFQMLNFRIALIITDQWHLSTQLADINKQIWSFSGLVYLSITFLWLIYGQAHVALLSIFLAVLIAAYKLRQVKSWRACHQANLEWYYLILYLCALEIMPVLYVWHWFSGEYN
ncbi:MAG: DUF4271 domain-containing protein [Sphingomonadales bacterium]